MGKEDDDTAMWFFGGLTVVCITALGITAMVLTAPASVTVGVGAAVGAGSASGTAYISTQKN